MRAIARREDGTLRHDVRVRDHSVVADEPIENGGEAAVEGQRNYRAWQSQTEGAMATTFEIEGGVDLGSGAVVVVGSLHVRGSASGVEVDQRMWLVAEVREAKVVRTAAFTDPDEALHALAARDRGAE